MRLKFRLTASGTRGNCRPMHKRQPTYLLLSVFCVACGADSSTTSAASSRAPEPAAECNQQRWEECETRPSLDELAGPWAGGAQIERLAAMVEGLTNSRADLATLDAFATEVRVPEIVPLVAYGENSREVETKRRAQVDQALALTVTSLRSFEVSEAESARASSDSYFSFAMLLSDLHEHDAFGRPEPRTVLVPFCLSATAAILIAELVVGSEANNPEGRKLVAKIAEQSVSRVDALIEAWSTLQMQRSPSTPDMTPIHVDGLRRLQTAWKRMAAD
jgi:hypothetical protein